MYVLSAETIRNWDRYTIAQEGISSLQLMERAAGSCVNWLNAQSYTPTRYKVFRGKGANGGDGLAIARMLLKQDLHTSVYILEHGRLGTEDFQQNLQRLQATGQADIHFIQEKSHLPQIESSELVIDAVYGTGLNRPLEGLAAELALHLNQGPAPVVSIDLPSGLFADDSSKGNTIVEADHTLTIGAYKTALMVAENAPFFGAVHLIDIGLHPGFPHQFGIEPNYLSESKIRKLFKKRNRFSHKGTFGHALLVGGSFGKIGAMVLAARACIHSGAGLTTLLSPRCGYTILQAAVPEAMVVVDAEEDQLSQLPDDLERYAAVGVGPGMGTAQATEKLLSFLIRRSQKPLVLDADALNLLSRNRDWFDQLPNDSILTPHPKEFDRLFGDHQSDVDRIKTAEKKSKELGVIILLKGHHSFVALPDGWGFYNSTGNAGMAKGGSGDALTGLLTALLSQGYTPKNAALLGVYLHGWAGDLSAKKLSQDFMTPSDLIGNFSDVFLRLNNGE